MGKIGEKDKQTWEVFYTEYKRTRKSVTGREGGGGFSQDNCDGEVENYKSGRSRLRW